MKSPNSGPKTNSCAVGAGSTPIIPVTPHSPVPDPIEGILTDYGGASIEALVPNPPPPETLIPAEADKG
jgi:hypothetical protein